MRGRRGREEQEEGQEGWPGSYSVTTGLPRPFVHGLCRLRPELTRAFIQHKTSQFSQRVRERMEENGGVEECTKNGDQRGTDAVRGACKDVGSVSDIIFEMRFNPDVFSPGVEFPSSDSSTTRLQERLLREAAAFIITHQIPAFVDDCLQFSVSPADGATLRQALHRRGINLRYLGQVTRALSQSENRERLKHITRLTFGEIVMRSAQRILNTYLQGVEVSSLSAAVSHFLCCLLVPHFSSAPVGEEPKKRSRRRGRGGGVASDSMAWSALSGGELWNLVCQDAKETYNLTEGLGTSVDHLVEQYGLQKVSLLRELCLKTGIQLRLREYALDNRSKAPIGPDDVLNVFPVVKHMAMTMSDASKLFHAAQANMQKGHVQQAYEQLKEAAYMFSRVCDDLHPDACACLSSLARLAYLQGCSAEARSMQLRVVVISERVLGFDHPNTIQEYALLAVYVFAGGELGLAQRCLYRARLLMLLIHGEEHPYTATLDSSLGLLLQGDQSIQFLQSALKLNTLFRGPTDLQTALNQHLLAQRLCTVGDYRGAMTHEREAMDAFQSQCGEDHPQTRCSADFLRAITQQAVQVERSLRQGGASSADTAIPDSLAPSMEATLEQLALVNGILKPTISNKIEELKEKLKEMRASAGVASEKTELALAINGGVAEEKVAGNDAEDEGRAHHVPEASDGDAENAAPARNQEETDSSRKTEVEDKTADEEPMSDHVTEEGGDQVTNGESESGVVDGGEVSLVDSVKPDSAENVTGQDLVTNDQLGNAEINGDEGRAGNDELGSTKIDLEQETLTTDDGQSGKSMIGVKSKSVRANGGPESAEVDGEAGRTEEITG
ncbi:hypothetical protein AAFF_G00066780 [Aldrovandia affinis]|uniref:CLU central domain-containing protein n=1 Tax=Aldrovandia affinis TaxID=143900 RepID=A0AAD7T450_9TELE|nr:hypothetical protein AAFF_G00066780 [Aldrovandia affinis]